jgi:hypothetical protein
LTFLAIALAIWIFVSALRIRDGARTTGEAAKAQIGSLAGSLMRIVFMLFSFAAGLLAIGGWIMNLYSV